MEVNPKGYNPHKKGSHGSLGLNAVNGALAQELV